jgi:hypothetical protein
VVLLAGADEQRLGQMQGGVFHGRQHDGKKGREARPNFTAFSMQAIDII